MRKRMLIIGLVLMSVAIFGAQWTVVSGEPGGSRATKFKVRIENIASADGETASDGTRWPFAVSPGIWVLDGRRDSVLFTPGKRVRSNGIEAQAEDGNPSWLVRSLEEGHHSSALHGVFNTPVGAAAPGPIVPGAMYEFDISARPGMRLSFTMMFGQSNDLFYAPESAIDLFDANGQPIGGDVTSTLALWDAGTEVNQEPGIGPDQAPRQKAPNMGPPENKRVAPVNDRFNYPKTTDVLRITITPETGV